jgi:hypothetical protein
MWHRTLETPVVIILNKTTRQGIAWAVSRYLAVKEIPILEIKGPSHMWIKCLYFLVVAVEQDGVRWDCNLKWMYCTSRC